MNRTLNLKFLTVVAIITAIAFVAIVGAINPAYADTDKQVTLHNATIRIERVMQLSGTETAREANPNWFLHTCSEGNKKVNETIDAAIAQYPSLERKLLKLVTDEPTTYSKKDGGCSWYRSPNRKVAAAKKVAKPEKLVAIVRVR